MQLIKKQNFHSVESHTHTKFASWALEARGLDDCPSADLIGCITFHH